MLGRKFKIFKKQQEISQMWVRNTPHVIKKDVLCLVNVPKRFLSHFGIKTPSNPANQNITAAIASHNIKRVYGVYLERIVHSVFRKRYKFIQVDLAGAKAP